MGRDRSDKRKRKHAHSHHRRHGDSTSDSESVSGSDESSSSSSDESTSGSSSSSSDHLSKKRHHSSSERKSSKMRGKHKKERRTKAKKRTRRASVSETLSMDDYFNKSAEFRAWLSKERKVFFSDLTSEQSRTLFKKFVSKWNKGLLKKKYYRGIQTAALDHETQTKYKWKFSSGVSKGDLKSLRECVTTWTAEEGDEREGAVGGEGGEEGERRRVIGPSPMPPSFEQSSKAGASSSGSSKRSLPYELEESKEEERRRIRKERKQMKKDQELVLDELLPRATGRLARVENKRARAEQRRGREGSPDVRESMKMGSSGPDIRQKLQARQTARQGRAIAAQEKISSYQEKERAKMAELFEMAKANRKEGALW